MRSKPVEHQNEHIVPAFIDEQPIRLHMAFSGSFVVPTEIVVPMFCVQYAAGGEGLNHFKQFI